MTMSLFVLPSPLPAASSASSLVACEMTTSLMSTLASQSSLTLATRLAIDSVAYWWLGGPRTIAPEVSTMVGGVTSLTLTVWTPEAELPCASFAVQVMVVVPTGYGALSGCESLRTPATVTPGQLSVAVAVPGSRLTLHEFGGALTLMFAGTLITGGVLSMTVTLWYALA